MNFLLCWQDLISHVIMTIRWSFFQTSQTKWIQVIFLVDNGFSLGKEQSQRQLNLKKDNENVFDSQNVLIEPCEFIY